jgi:predicted kinase
MSRLILIRGLPGSGKSTLARTLTQAGYCHYEADQFFEMAGSGTYKFDPAKLQAAHAWCLNAARYRVEWGDPVVISNTFSRQWEIQPYQDLAKEFGIKPQIIECKGQFGNIHNVPEEVIQKMKARWEEITL